MPPWVCIEGYIPLVYLPITRFTVGLGIGPRAPLLLSGPLRTVTFLSKRREYEGLLTVLGERGGLGGPMPPFLSRFTVGQS